MHIPGISKARESRLWNLGITDWDICLTETKNRMLSAKHLWFVQKSKEEAARKNHLFFSPLLERTDHWRAYPEFSDRCAFIDIETTGLSKERNRITTIALYDGKDSKVFINGKNLDSFPKVMEDYSMIVTYNGICFDVPFIEH